MEYGCSQRTKARGFRILCDELGTPFHDPGNFHQYIFRCINLRWFLVVQNERVSSFDSDEQFCNGCIQIRLCQNQLSRITLIDAIEKMDTYKGGRSQRGQRHLSVWVNLCMIINQNLTISF